MNDLGFAYLQSRAILIHGCLTRSTEYRVSKAKMQTPRHRRKFRRSRKTLRANHIPLLRPVSRTEYGVLRSYNTPNINIDIDTALAIETPNPHPQPPRRSHRTPRTIPRLAP